TIARCAAGNPRCRIWEPAWSPDGKRLAFVRGRISGPLPGPYKMSVWVVGSDGGGARRLATCGDCGAGGGEHIGWSPDGRWIAFSRDEGLHGEASIWVVAASGGRPYRLTHCGTCGDQEPTWSPKGNQLLFARDRGPSVWIYSVRPDGS